MQDGNVEANGGADPLPAGDGHSLYLFDPSGLPGAAEWRAELERTSAEARRVHRARLVDALAGAGMSDAEGLAEVALAALFIYPDVETGEPCSCSCHPHLPSGDLHDYGRACSCTRTKQERLAWWAEWRQEMDDYWESPEGIAEIDAREREESELRQWLVDDGGIVVTQFGGWAPEQWRGTVDGHSFYFRERHDHWRIELDLRPTGRFYKVFKGGDLDDPSSFDQEEALEGDVIAEGTTGSPGYGATRRQRAEFLARTIRGHIARRDCRVHIEDLHDLELRFGRRIDWCPGCGQRI
jgi:hypothetical protein